MAPVIVLFYHRIADDAGNPWTIVESRIRRANGLARGAVRFGVAGRSPAPIVEKQNRRPAVSITFDDGYAANCDEAMPLLIARKIPCTYFVSQPLRARRDSVSARRGRAVAECRPNTLAQIRTMAAAGIEIGAHTRTHADIGRLHNPRKLHDEVVGSGQTCSKRLGRPVRYFAFPFGQPTNMNAAAFHLAQNMATRRFAPPMAATTFPATIRSIFSGSYPDNMLRLKNWLTVDPRKAAPPLSLRLPSRCRAGAGRSGRPMNRAPLSDDSRRTMIRRTVASPGLWRCRRTMRARSSGRIAARRVRLCRRSGRRSSAPALAHRHAGRKPGDSAGAVGRAAADRLCSAGVGLPLAGAEQLGEWDIAFKFLMLAGAAFGAGPARFVWPVYGALPPPRTFEDAAAAHGGWPASFLSLRVDARDGGFANGGFGIDLRHAGPDRHGAAAGASACWP